MRAHFRQTADRRCKFFCDNSRFQRTKTDPLNPVHLMHCLNQRQQIFLILRAFFSVRTQMDPRQYHFLTAGCCKAFYFIYHILCLFAADPSSGIRDDTVGTELVAAVLHFQVCSCMFFGTVNLQIFILFRVIDVHTFCGFLMTCPVTF